MMIKILFNKYLWMKMTAVAFFMRVWLATVNLKVLGTQIETLKDTTLPISSQIFNNRIRIPFKVTTETFKKIRRKDLRGSTVFSEILHQRIITINWATIKTAYRELTVSQITILIRCSAEMTVTRRQLKVTIKLNQFFKIDRAEFKMVLTISTHTTIKKIILPKQL